MCIRALVNVIGHNVISLPYFSVSIVKSVIFCVDLSDEIG